jgi:hypothetical protein
MDCVRDPTLIATKQPSDTEYNVPEFELGMRGRIERIDNAKDPVAGFVVLLKIKIENKTKGLSVKPRWIL